MNVCVLVGSLRKASFSRMLAQAMISLAPPSMKPDIVEIGQMPLYNEDLETATPLRVGPRSDSASRLLTRFCSSRPNITGR
jgi:NAD(P)H-dependent FMN reductase